MKRWFWILDTSIVVSFAVLGRESHGFVTDIGEDLRVAAPFLIALAVGIVAFRAWRNPTGVLTGLGLGVTTVVLGMMLRKLVWDDGTATTFVLVTSGYVIGLMVGWRLILAGIERIARRAAAT